MKRAVILYLIVISLLLVPFSSLAEDYSVKTDDELYAMIDQIRTELLTRQKDSEKIVYQTDSITIYFNKAEIEENYDGKHNLLISITGISTSDKDLGVFFDKIFVNGWEVDEGLVEVSAGKKTKKTITIYQLEDKADDIQSVEDIKDIEFQSHTYDPETYENLTDIKTMSITIQ